MKLKTGTTHMKKKNFFTDVYPMEFFGLYILLPGICFLIYKVLT